MPIAHCARLAASSNEAIIKPPDERMAAYRNRPLERRQSGLSNKAVTYWALEIARGEFGQDLALSMRACKLAIGISVQFPILTTSISPDAISS